MTAKFYVLFEPYFKDKKRVRECIDISIDICIQSGTMTNMF